MFFVDTETCGLYGLPITIQYAKNDGEIKIHEIWHEKPQDTLDLIEEIAEDGIVGFNLVFDWFHLCKIYTTLKEFNSNDFPANHIIEMAFAEKIARDGLCVKPKAACDLMLVARKGKYQSLMPRKPITIRKIPVQLAYQLAEHLDNTIEFNPLFFAKGNLKGRGKGRWSVLECKNYNGEVLEDFRNIQLKFKPSTALKALAMDALKVDATIYSEIEIDPVWRPNELGYAPFALAIGNPTKWNWAWPEVIEKHIDHWRYMSSAREYAIADVDYTRRLWCHFDKPKLGDVDSDLTCMVAATRWKGFAVDLEYLKKLRLEAEEKVKSTPTAPKQAKLYIHEVLSPEEKLIVKNSTKRVVLEELAKWDNDDGSKHLAATRAQEVLDARRALKEIELFDKLLLAERFHASFNVMGTLSSRMAGGEGLNAQGINHTKKVRKAFTLAFENEIASGGDFESFEVSIFDAAYPDPNLRADLLSGVKIHTLMAESFFPDKSREEILASKGTTNDMYDTGKKGIFATFYGGDEKTLANRLGLKEEIAIAGYTRFTRRYSQAFDKKRTEAGQFCSMRQDGGPGTKVTWSDPADYVESFLGFRRYFTLENTVCKALFDLAANLPKDWRNVKLKVKRNDRLQTASGAVSSALYGAAFNIQSKNLRAAGNHRIQSPGAQITKHFQWTMWQLQPVGVSEWRVRMLNVHDEIMSAHKNGMEVELKRTIDLMLERYKEQVPLIRMDWKERIKSWAEKS